jgi:hypothetical protein
VFGALKREVVVKHHIEKRKGRLADKFGSRWKLLTDMRVTAIIMVRTGLKNNNNNFVLYRKVLQD